MMEFPPAGGWSRDTRKQFEGNTMAVDQTSGPEVRLLNLHFFNICRHHPTLKFKPRATDDERYVWGIDGVPLMRLKREGRDLANRNDRVIKVWQYRFSRALPWTSKLFIYVVYQF